MGEIVRLDFCGGVRPGQLVIETCLWSLDAHMMGVTDQGNVIDATLVNGVKERGYPKDDYHWTRSIGLDFLTTKEREGLYSAVKQREGCGYDISAIVGWPLKRNWQAPDKWFCSELYAQAVLEVGLFGQIPKRRITPTDMYHAFLYLKSLRRATKAYNI